MASELEIRTACKLVDDNTDLAESLADLASIFGGTETVEIIIQRGEEQFNLGRLKTKIEEKGDDFDVMVTDFETAMLGLIGADDITAGTFRKAIADLVALNDARVAGT